MNEDDSKQIRNFLLRNSLNEVENENEAEILIINTCTVRQHAEDKAISLIGRLKKWRNEKNRKLLVIGCAAERIKDKIVKRFDYVDYVVGAKSFNEIFPLLENLIQKSKDEKKDLKLFSISEYQTISRGCSLKCSYCVVPFVRGEAKHLSFSEIINETKIKAKNGVREITLLGQTVNSYKDSKYDFTDLLKEISQIDEIKIIRFLSPHPLFFNDKFFREFETNKKISRHIHLPLQSASDKILKLMKRGYNYSKFKEIVQRLRAIDPKTSITTDMIVGFTEETQQDFEKSLNALEELRFSMVFCFKYSPRFKNIYPLTITKDELKLRHQTMLKKAKEIAKSIIEEKINSIETALIKDDKGNGKTLTGYNCCIIDNTENIVGKLIEGKVEYVKENTLVLRRLS